jgi:hypothetical protein
VFETVRQSFEAKKEAYEASAGVIACLVLAALFGLGAVAIWLASYVGPILCAVCLSAAFIVIAGLLELVSRSKHHEAGEKFEEAEEQVSDAAQAVKTTVASAAAIPAKPSVWLPLLLGAAIFLVILEKKKFDFVEPDELRL